MSLCQQGYVADSCALASLTTFPPGHKASGLAFASITQHPGSDKWMLKKDADYMAKAYIIYNGILLSFILSLKIMKSKCGRERWFWVSL